MIILSIFLKEFIDLMRDRRALVSGFAYVAFGPLVILMTVSVLATEARNDNWSSIRFCGPSSPLLEEELKAARLEFAPDAAICVLIPEDFETRLADGRTARVQIRGDLLAQSTTIDRVEGTILRFASTLSTQRLLARGMAPTIANPVSVETQNNNSYSRAADLIARMLILFLVLSPFIVSVAAAADMTAGERERRSIEPLLVHPVSALSIVIGKWMAAAALGVVGTTACVLGGLYLMEQSELAQLGIRLDTSLGAGLLVSLYLVPITLLAAAIQVTVGFWSRNFKDAQSYLMLISFVPAVAGFMLTGERLAAAANWPLAWEMNTLAGPLLGAPPTSVPFAVIAAIELALVAALLALSARRLRSEAILSHG